MIRTGLAAALLLSAFACGGDGVLEGPDGPGTAPTLTELQASVFTPNCAIPGCHAGPTPEQGMDLSDGQTFAHTVNVDVVELSGYVRVLPGNSADSYLYMKITADPRIVGGQMPFGGPPLSAEQVEAVKAWIDAGAMND